MKKMIILLFVLGLLSTPAPTTAPGRTVDPLLRAGIPRIKDPFKAPAFALKDLEGRAVELEDFRGKIVLLDFWATW